MRFIEREKTHRESYPEDCMVSNVLNKKKTKKKEISSKKLRGTANVPACVQMILPDGSPKESFAAVAGRGTVVLSGGAIPAYGAVLRQDSLGRRETEHRTPGSSRAHVQIGFCNKRRTNVPSHSITFLRRIDASPFVLRSESAISIAIKITKKNYSPSVP